MSGGPMNVPGGMSSGYGQQRMTQSPSGGASGNVNNAGNRMMYSSQPFQQQGTARMPMMGSPRMQSPAGNFMQQGYNSSNAETAVTPSTTNQQQQPTQQQPAQKQDLNTATICRIGQETVQEIIGRTHEVFSYLKTLQPPVGSAGQDRANIEKQQRLHEVLKGITVLFRRLYFCWKQAHEHSGAMEYANIESLIPLKADRDVKVELEKKRGEAYRQAFDENAELTQQLIAKNRRLKEIIDQMRVIIWEVNTMLAMR